MAKQLIEGIGVTVDGDDLQQAVIDAGKAYKERYGKPAKYVSFPTEVDISGLTLWTLQIAAPYGVGVVIVGHMNGNDARQMELFK